MIKFWTCVLEWVSIKNNEQPDGGFKYVLFSSLFGEDEPILTIIFFRWVGSTTNQSRSSRVVRDDMFGAMPFNASLKWVKYTSKV